MNVLVAGGAGMIGSHLCETLVRAGHEVVCLDNLSTARFENLAILSRMARFRFIQHDITRELPALPPPDRIYHLASPASPVGYTRLPIETMLANSEGTRRLCELAIAHHARFLFCSTSEIYGDPLQHPQREDYRGNVSTLGPRAAYDESKRYGEAMTMTFARAYGLNGRIVRIFNTYGPRADLNDGRVVVNFIVQAMLRKPMTIYGDGRQTRSMCYVTDLVDGLMRAMDCEGTQGEVMNLGNPEEYTVLEIAETVRRLTGSDSPFEFTAPAVGDDPRMRRPDNGRARTLLGWEPRTPLAQGLQVMIDAVATSLDGAVRAHHGAQSARGLRSTRPPLPAGSVSVNGHAHYPSIHAPNDQPSP